MTAHLSETNNPKVPVVWPNFTVDDLSHILGSNKLEKSTWHKTQHWYAGKR